MSPPSRPSYRQRLFRTHEEDAEAKVTNIELFFDLVFVFAITQLSHRLLEHLSLHGALEALVLFGAVWWLWIFTSWATNWLDPERGPVRFMLMAMMLGGLILAASIPKAFETAGWTFALTYVALQLMRTLAIAWVASDHNPARARNFLRISFYFALAAPLWIGGALSEGDARLALWAGAVAIEYAGPLVFFRTPGLGASTVDDWDISGSHMAERCALFIIIALGEAILLTGATFAGLKSEPGTIAAFATSVIGSCAMWWLYFDTGAKRGGEAIEAAETGDTARLARNAYTYLHMPIVAGIVVTAVGEEMMLTHPLDHADLGFVLVTCGGPALFLLGNQAFKWMIAERSWPPLSHFVGQGLLLAIAIVGLAQHWTPLAIGFAATLALVMTAIWEWFSVNGGWRRWLPWIESDRPVHPDRAAG